MHGWNFQDYSWIQEFEADFPHKVSLKLLNQTDNDSFSDLLSIYLLTIDYLNFEIVNIL